MLDELRQVLRGLARSRTTAAVLFLSLALGTGANTTLFSVMDALLFRPPPGVTTASRLTWVFTSQFTGASYGLSSYPDFLSLQAKSGALEQLAAFDDSAVVAVKSGDSLQRLRAAAVSSGFFPALGMRAQRGRLLTAADEAAVEPAVVISDSFWMLLGRPEDVLGRALTIAGRPHVVVGVAPPQFSGLQLGRVCDLWTPLIPATDSASRGDRRLSLLGVLREGRTASEASAEVETIGATLAATYPETNRGTRTDPDEPRRMTASRYSRLDPSARRQVALISTVVLGSTGLLLLSACVNAGSLLLSRSAARRRELAVKLALGASRRFLVRQIVVESLVVSLGGAALGLLLAHWAAGVLPAFFAPEEAAMLDTSLDGAVIGITIALAGIAGALFAAGPARHAMQTVDIQVLRGDAGPISDRAGGSFRSAVVVGQVALSTVLLIATGLMVRALTVALDGDLGPGGRGVAIAVLRMPGVLKSDVVRGLNFNAAGSGAARKIPGAQATGWVATLPVGRSTNQTFQFKAGAGRITERVDVDVNVATTGYFQAMQIPLVEGRLFTADDGALAKPVVVVNDILARRYFGAAAVGHRLHDVAGTEFEIIGVVRSGKYRTLQEAPEPMVYFPLSQRYRPVMHLVVRTAHAPGDVVAALPDALTRVDPDVMIWRTFTFDDHLAEALTLDRILTTVVAGCGLAALILATIGVYGVVGDAVRRRTPEIGLRVALGAPASRILRLVFSEGLPLTLGGSACGIAAALLLARLLRAYVPALPPVDLVSLAVVPVVLLLVVLGAAALPVRRALKVSPAIALRPE